MSRRKAATSGNGTWAHERRGGFRPRGAAGLPRRPVRCGGGVHARSDLGRAVEPDLLRHPRQPRHGAAQAAQRADPARRPRGRPRVPRARRAAPHWRAGARAGALSR